MMVKFLGAHMSIEGGLHKAFERANSIEIDCFQIFTKSNRQWEAKPLETKKIDQFFQWKENFKIEKLIAHASYLINLCSENPATQNRSILALEEELERCDTLEIPYLVLHPGSCGTANKEDGIKKLTENLNRIFENKTYKTKLLLENMAGQVSSIASTP